MYDILMTKTGQIALAWELYKQRMPKIDIAKVVEVHRETIGIWIAGIERIGIHDYIEEYLHAKKGERKKRKIDGLVKQQIYRVRENHKGCCGQKIKEYLRREGITSPGVTAIYKVLGEKYQLRRKLVRNVKRGKLPTADTPRQVIQMDTVDFGGVYAFTSVDICSRDVAVRLYPDCRSKWGADFLHTAFKKQFSHVQVLQTDGGSEFKDEFKAVVSIFADRHRVARPYKKNEQAFIESFNKTLRKECLGWNKYPLKELPYLQKEVREFLNYYHNDRIHMSLNMQTPNEVLKHYQLLSDF